MRPPPDPVPRRVAAGIAAVNRHAGREALLATELKRLQVPQIRELDRLIGELARRWLGPGPALRPVERRNRLDLRRTLRANLQRHGGYVLTFRWAVRQRPRPRLQRPARLLVIGDVSHSMCHYVTVVLYFFHMLNFRFEVESYVFSEHATRASPYLSGPGGFSEKVQALAQHARSWNAGTRFGTSLEEILAEAAVDPHTYVVIATDGKVSLSHGEPAKIRRQMERLRRESRMVILLTPEADLARAGRNRAAPVGSGDGRPDGVVGIFKAGLVEIPIFDLPSVWYEVLGQHADRVYHVRTVQDLVDMVEDLNRMAPPVSPEPASPGGYELGR
nr:MAG: hypothetical protein DIU70_04660 [Bacillota bacterium]